MKKKVVENIERKRQAYPTLEAIYFLTPCRESILRLVDDFSRTPTYKAAHVHFTSGKKKIYLGTFFFIYIDSFVFRRTKRSIVCRFKPEVKINRRFRLCSKFKRALC